MTKALLLAIIMSISVGTWAYTKFQNRTGYGNAGTTSKAAGVVAIATFVVVFTIGKFVLFH